MPSWTKRQDGGREGSGFSVSGLGLGALGTHVLSSAGRGSRLSRKNVHTEFNGVRSSINSNHRVHPWFGPRAAVT